MEKEQFCWYLSGFADGESFFLARPLFRETKKGYKRTAFSFRWGIQVREDDEPILLRIKEHLDSYGIGEGFIYHRKRKNDVSGQVTLHYDGLKHCGVIRYFFEHYPLQAKKAKDFERWAEIYDRVEELNSSKPRKNPDDYTEQEIAERLEIVKLCDLLRLGRLDKGKDDMSVYDLLKEQSGQGKLYTELFLKHQQINEYAIV